MIEDRGRKVEAKILTHGGSWFESKAKGRGEQHHDNSSKGNGKGKGFKVEGKGKCEESCCNRCGKRGHLARDCLDRFERQRQ